MTAILAKIRKRIGTAAQWAIANPILALGEEGFESDTRQFKVGDGVTEYNDLEYEHYSQITKTNIDSWNSKQEQLGIATTEIAGIVVRADNTEVLTGDNEEKYVTPKTVKNAIDSAIALLILNAPGALDTLDELAAALGNDPHFATTVLTAISERVRIDEIVNSLTSTSTDKPLAAAQGKVISDLIAALSSALSNKIAYSDIINTLLSDLTDKPLSAAQGKALKALIDAHPTTYPRKIFKSNVVDVLGSATASEEIYHAVQISGNEVVSGDSIDVEAFWTSSSLSTSQKQFYIRAYSINSLSGITDEYILANFQNNNSTGTSVPIKLKQDITVKVVGAPVTSTLEAAYINSGAATQGLLSLVRNPNVDITNTWYILITAKKAVVADVITLKSVKVFINKK